MARVYRARPDWAYLLSKANGERTAEQVDVAESVTPYEVGTTLTPEYVTEGVGEDAVRVKTGLYVRLTRAILDGEDEVKPVILATRTVATSGVAPALVTARDAEVKSFELEPIEDVEADELAAVLEAKSNIIVRSPR